MLRTGPPMACLWTRELSGAEAYALLGRKAEALDSLEKAEANGYYERWP